MSAVEGDAEKENGEIVGSCLSGQKLVWGLYMAMDACNGLFGDAGRGEYGGR